MNMTISLARNILFQRLDVRLPSAVTHVHDFVYMCGNTTCARYMHPGVEIGVYMTVYTNGNFTYVGRLSAEMDPL